MGQTCLPCLNSLEQPPAGAAEAALRATHLPHLLGLLGSARDPLETNRRINGGPLIMTQRDVRKENIILISDEESWTLRWHFLAQVHIDIKRHT